MLHAPGQALAYTEKNPVRGENFSVYSHIQSVYLAYALRINVNISRLKGTGILKEYEYFAH